MTRPFLESMLMWVRSWVIVPYLSLHLLYLLWKARSNTTLFLPPSSHTTPICFPGQSRRLRQCPRGLLPPLGLPLSLGRRQPHLKTTRRVLCVNTWKLVPVISLFANILTFAFLSFPTHMLQCLVPRKVDFVKIGMRS